MDVFARVYCTRCERESRLSCLARAGHQGARPRRRLICVLSCRGVCPWEGEGGGEEGKEHAHADYEYYITVQVSSGGWIS